MDKKTIIQITIALVFFSISAYVFLNYSNISLSGFKISEKSQVTSDENDLKIEALLIRDFKLGKIDLFEDPKFKSLKESSAILPGLTELESSAGKKDLFEKTNK